MTKEEFLIELNQRLITKPDKDEIVSYYYELLSDRVDAGEKEEDVFTEEKLNEITESLKKDSDTPEVKTGTEVSVSEEDALAPEEEKAPEVHELSGGRKFWYVIWCIATVCFCILSVATELACVGIIGYGGVWIGFSIPAFSESAGLGIVYIGLGLFIIGAGITGGHYAIILQRFMFRHRKIWNETIYSKLGGRRS